MKKIYWILLALPLVWACNDEDLPTTSRDLWQVEQAAATAGDMTADVSWTPSDKRDALSYYLSWTSATVGVEGGDTTVNGSTTGAHIEDLVNGATYTFSVQAVYANGMSGKVSASCAPASTRPAATGFLAAAGDGRVRLSWNRPDTDLVTGYRITWSPGNGSATINDPDTGMYIVDGLNNYEEYTFILTCVYPHGDSDIISTTATPGVIFPILLAETELVLNEVVTFRYNTMYFIQDEIASVSWDFGDGNTSTEHSPGHSFATQGNYTVKVTVTYNNGRSESGEIQVSVNSYSWTFSLLEHGGTIGFVKNSNPVFSRDGRTIYMSTSSPNGHLFAVDMVSGEVKWVYQIQGVTYGGGAMVGDDGTIYTCSTDKVIYAVNPDGTLKWKYETNGVMGAYPALGADGTVYCLSNGSTLYALNSSNGNVKWQRDLDGGTGGAIVIDRAGTIYAGTYSAVYAFDDAGNEKWKLSGLAVTERGSFALDGTTLYAALRGVAGLASINTLDGTLNWTCEAVTGSTDSFFPVVDPAGNIYFTAKASGTVHAVDRNGNLLWTKYSGANTIYAGLSLDQNGVLYAGTQGKVGSDWMMYGYDSATGDIVFQYASDKQLMGATTIGPDKRLYFGGVGAGTVPGAIFALPIDSGLESGSWSMRGGDIHGTNRQK